MKSKYCILVIVLVFAVLYLLLLGVRPLIMPDEARYVEIPREMLADHDYVTPHLNGLRYFEKPIMGYWLIAGSMRVFGETRFAARFVPAVCTGLAALIVAFLAAKMTGRKEQGWFAAGCFLLMPLVFFVGTTCTLDAIFSLFVTATVAAFYLAMEEFERKRTAKCMLWLLATGAAAGCAFLTKGFLAFALPVVAVLPWLIWSFVDDLLLQKRAADEQADKAFRDPFRYVKAIFTLPWLPFVVALIVIAPWAILIHRAEPDFWRYFVVEEHFSRFFGIAKKVEHPQGPFFFVLTLLWGAGVCLPLTPAIALGFWKLDLRGKNASWFRFLICWFAGPFLFLSASKGKLPTYILPCFPALAIMISAALFRYFEERSDGKGKLFNIPVLVFCGLGLIAGPAVVAALGYVLPNYFDISIFGKEESWKLVLLSCAINPIFFLAGAAVVLKKTPVKLLCYLLAVASVFLVSFFVVPQDFYDTRCVTSFISDCKEEFEITPDTLIIAHGSNVHAVCYTFHRNDIFMDVAGELEYGLSDRYPDAAGREVKGSNVKKFVKLHPDKKIVMFFPANRYYYHKSVNILPEPIFLIKSIPTDPDSKDADGMVFVRFQ